MSRRIGRLVVVGLVLVAGAGGTALGVKTRQEARRLVTNPADTRKMPEETPADRGLFFEDVTIASADGLAMRAWYVPTPTGRVVTLVHGYKDHRGNMLGLAAILARAGYGVLLPALRAHDASDGDLLTFGVREMDDLMRWHRWLQARPGVDPARMGLFGVSMGGTLAIQHAAENPGVRALVADCAFSSIRDTVETSVKFFTGLPPFPFAPLILFWMEREIGADADTIDAKVWIGRISPRPIFLLQGGADVVISADSGARLLAAAGDPKELWFDPELGHAQFLDKRPAEFERRVLEFYGRYLR